MIESQTIAECESACALQLPGNFQSIGDQPHQAYDQPSRVVDTRRLARHQTRRQLCGWQRSGSPKRPRRSLLQHQHLASDLSHHFSSILRATKFTAVASSHTSPQLGTCHCVARPGVRCSYFRLSQPCREAQRPIVHVINDERSKQPASACVPLALMARLLVRVAQSA